MFEKFAAPSRNAVRYGVEEAGRRGDRRIGTDHLLMGLLHDEDTATVIGLTVSAARSKADVLDVRALEAIGIPIGDFRPSTRPRRLTRTPLTSGARSVLQRTVTFTTAEHSRRIMPRHLLLALLERDQPDPAAVLLAECGVDGEELTRRLSAPDR